MEEMYLGIDPSTASTGFAVMDSNFNLVDYGVIKVDKKKLTELEQTVYQYDKINELVEKYGIVGIGCEDQFQGPNAQTFKQLSRVAGSFIVLAALQQIELEMLHPSKWRKITHGKGSMKKEDTRVWVNETYNKEFKKKDNDITDAIGIAKAFALLKMGEQENAKNTETAG